MQRSAENPCFLPDLCAARPLLALVMVTELMSVVLVLAQPHPFADFWGEFSFLSLYAQWIALASAALLCGLGRWLGRLDHALAGILAWILITLVAAVVALVTLVALPANLAPEPGNLLVRTLAISGILAAMVLRYLYQSNRQRELALAESRARLHALQARMRPHFLFNSLNSISSLIRLDPAGAENMVVDLADLIRANLDSGGSSTLGRELELSRRYLDIEAVRLGPRLRLQWDVAEAPPEAELPPLSLQPLVENAIRHGIEPAEAGGELLVRVRSQGEEVEVLVQSPLGLGSNAGSGLGMALANLRERLQLAFGEAAQLQAGPAGGSYLARLRFPLRTAGAGP